MNAAPPVVAALERFLAQDAARGLVSVYLCTDPELDHAFVRDVQLRAADVDLFLRRTRRVKLAALER